MQHPMRRFKQLLSEEDTKAILERGITLTLALQGDEKYPYSVPVNYAWEENHIYIHCAKDGHKNKIINYNPYVSFSILDKEDIIQEKFTTYFSSVIGFGTVKKVESPEEVIHALRLLIKKYSPNYVNEGEIEIASGLPNVAIIRIDIQEVTGKEAIELVNMRY